MDPQDLEDLSARSRLRGLESLMERMEARVTEMEQGHAIMISMNVELMTTLELLIERVIGTDQGSEVAQAFMSRQRDMRAQVWETIRAAHPEAINDMDPKTKSALENLVRGSNAPPRRE